MKSVILLSLSMISCGAIDNLENNLADNQSSANASNTSTVSTSDKCSRKNTKPVTVQPKLPMDWRERIASWPITVWADSVTACYDAALVSIAECMPITSSIQAYAEETCQCITTGIESNYWYGQMPKDITPLSMEWVSWCAYNYGK